MSLRLFKLLLGKRKKNTWNEQYLEGKWDTLRSNWEDARFDVMRKFMGSYSVKGKILEIGCGEGLLQAQLDPVIYSSYLGIDISEVAVQRALYLENSCTRYRAADMEEFNPAEKFDMIIFNESLYYAKCPCSTMLKYMGFLEENGVFITSIYETTRNKRLIKKINKFFKPVESAVTANDRGRWHCQVYRKCTRVKMEKNSTISMNLFRYLSNLRDMVKIYTGWSLVEYSDCELVLQSIF